MYKLKVVEVILQRFREPRKRIQVVAGPRQVGKTTSVEQALSEYHGGYTYKLAEGLGLSPLDWLIAEWNAARVKAKSEGGHLLVIDEIHKIKGWSRIVKRLWDEDSFNHVELKVCLLGSSRLLLQKGLDESLAEPRGSDPCDTVDVIRSVPFYELPPFPRQAVGAVA